MIVRRRSPEAAERTLEAFLARARLSAATRVILAEDVPFVETIAANSSDSAVSFVGLRAPRPDEAPTAFGDYMRGMCEGLAGVPYPVFTLAAEDVDFNGIFN